MRVISRKANAGDEGIIISIFNLHLSISITVDIKHEENVRNEWQFIKTLILYG
jgi:hypothetical protein